MENEIKIFENEQFGTIRTTTIDDEPWFVAADVCRALEVGNSRQALTRLDDDEKFTTVISNDGAATGKSSMSFVNEPGLYSLVLGSRKPEAKAFKRWITHEVIPAIRKTGMYAAEALLNDPELAIAAFTALRDERNRRMQLEAEIEPPEVPTVSEMNAANQLTVFENPEFGKVRMKMIDGNPWFVGKDVAAALGYGDGKSLANAVAKYVDSEDKGVTKMMTPGGMQNVTIINESGVYALVFGSKLPSAKKFKHWVTHEVLPAIRKTGGYIAGEEHMTDEELVGRALLIVNAKLNFYEVEKDTDARSVSCVMWLYTKQYGLQQK